MYEAQGPGLRYSEVLAPAAVSMPDFNSPAQGECWEGDNVLKIDVLQLHAIPCITCLVFSESKYERKGGVL